MRQLRLGWPQRNGYGCAGLAMVLRGDRAVGRQGDGATGRQGCLAPWSEQKLPISERAAPVRAEASEAAAFTWFTVADGAHRWVVLCWVG